MWLAVCVCTYITWCAHEFCVRLPTGNTCSAHTGWTCGCGAAAASPLPGCQICLIPLTCRTVPFSQNHRTNCHSHSLCAGYLSKQKTQSYVWNAIAGMLYRILPYALNNIYALTCTFTTEFTPTKLVVVAENHVFFSVQKFIFPPLPLLLIY